LLDVGTAETDTGPDAAPEVRRGRESAGLDPPPYGPAGDAEVLGDVGEADQLEEGGGGLQHVVGLRRDTGRRGRTVRPLLLRNPAKIPVRGTRAAFPRPSTRDSPTVPARVHWCCYQPRCRCAVASVAYQPDVAIVGSRTPAVRAGAQADVSQAFDRH